MMYWSVVGFVVLQHVSGFVQECPKGITCISILDRHSCPENMYFRENVRSFNCCPGCIPLQDLDMPCQNDKECAPGLSCQQSTTGYLCKDDKRQSCEYYKRNDEVWTKEHYWQPDCQADGTYAPKQCKGERPNGKCMCMNEDGERIFGEQSWANSKNMTCACSRLVESLRRKERKHISVHCDENGNFEELQCNDSICWCSNERTGIPYTTIVPETMVHLLPCFNEGSFGSQYLRQCDSSVVNSKRALDLLSSHGTVNVVILSRNCNYDGSYGRAQKVGQRTSCVSKNNTILTYPENYETDCNCAYDKFIATEIEGKDFNFECFKGSYLKTQYHGNYVFFVDKDGFPYSFNETESMNATLSRTHS